MAAPPVTLETADIQGLVVRGYGVLPEATFLVLAVDDAERAREYLRGLCVRVNRADDSPVTHAIQIAFTAPGLAELGVPASARREFSRELLEGMDDDVRAELLGDRGDNDPSTWEWGRRGEPVHALLLVYARNAKMLAQTLDEERAAFAGGFRILHEKTTKTLGSASAPKEHFGWRDGLSMPKIDGVVPADGEKKKQQESWTGPIAAGELVLGYPNDYTALTECPTVEAQHDMHDHLPRVHPGSTRKSLGKNGTYLVFREMTQDVQAFWRYLATSREPGETDEERAIALGAKMVGRWPNGAPLVTSPERDDPNHATDNAFRYTDDRAGLACPHGAHIRRSNPRDVLSVEERGTDASLSMVRKHQMVRRGRPFGPPLVDSMDAGELFAARDQPGGERRGLYFICLVGDISRQFEFVQRAWIHSANFDSMFKDGDPISAARRPPGHENPNDEFTCPATPVRRKYRKLPQFTRLVGGAYFFLPGLAALRFIARKPR